MFHKVSIGALGRAVGSLVSNNFNAQTHFYPGVLYTDRGVIALNKPPGLVSQGALSTKAGTIHNHSKEKQDAVPSNFAFNAVLDGTFLSLVLLLDDW